MPNKPPRTISDHIALLKGRGMLFRDEATVPDYLKNISYYRLKGYWWDLQSDYATHTFKPGTYFEDIIDRYNFDRNLRIILFEAIEHIEIALRTKMIHHLSLSYGGTWYVNQALFENTTIEIKGIRKTIHLHALDELYKEFNRSQEIFIKDHKRRYPGQNADSWKTLEVASMGTISKLYKNLKHQLPEKSTIAKEMGLNLHSELSSWLESIAYIRNIIAHHSRLWCKNMVKKPIETINNPLGFWFNNPLDPVQTKKPFLIISTMVYLCNHIYPCNFIRNKLISLIASNPSIQIYKLGFLNNWDKEPIWKKS